MDKCFLCFRQQNVVVNGVRSDWGSVVSCVPQGPILGPFALYINDISVALTLKSGVLLMTVFLPWN